MFRQLLVGLKRFILWDFPRASWQYDVMVGLILGFIFLSPSDWFRDQPRVPRASQIAILPAAHGTNVFWIDAEVVSSIPPNERMQKVADLLKFQTGIHQPVVRLDPVLDSENEVKGYLAVAKP